MGSSVSEELIALYRTAAADGQNFRGLSILQHRSLLAKLCKRHDAKSLLDYGCGAGDAYRSPHRLHHDLRIKRQNVGLYDPAFPDLATPPVRRYDAVLCSDVLEHIPEPEVGGFLDTLVEYANKFVWASVCCRPAKKSFPDGTNMHVTVQPFEWWQAKAAAVAKSAGVPFYIVETP